MPIQFILFLVLTMAGFVIGNYFLRKAGKPVPMFAQAILVWFAAYSIFKFVMYPPIPVSLLYTFMGLITIVLFIFVSSTEASWTEFKRPIVNTLMAETPVYKSIRTVSLVALPALIGYTTYANLAPKFLQYAREGGAIFFQNCHFCHGDNLNGRGMFAFAFNPIPANFADPGTIAQLQETFVFWRVSKGGPGLPREGFPWASAMPPWEQHLTTDEIWKVIMFEYWHTNFYPRTWD
jgi:hypothetical protein